MARRNRRPTSSEDAQAATAAPATVTLSNGKQLRLAPLTIKDLAEVGRLCLDEWRRDQLEILHANKDLLGDSYTELMRETLSKLQDTTLEDLPQKSSTAPDGKTHKVPYYMWWMQQPGTGIYASLWVSLRHHHPTLTLEDTTAMFDNRLDDLRRAADVLGEVSTSMLAAGNS